MAKVAASQNPRGCLQLNFRTIVRIVRICTLQVLSMCRVLAIAAVLSLGLTMLALADDPTFQITMKNNQFVPSDVQIQAGTKVKLVVRNDNQTTSEFESNQFHREKVVGPGQEITVYVGPLAPGSYEFFDDFHPQTRGHLIVK